MTMFHAVVSLDHHAAQVLQFDAEHVQAQKVKAHHHVTRQHQSQVRSEHEFYGHVCDALAGVQEVLVFGSHQSLADFRHYAEKHRPQTARVVVGYETIDHPSEGQLVAMARKWFLKFDRMAGTPTPT
jgi:stalled ribosome rescue protein Dom34